jgi:hypothetical protein
LNLKCDVLVFWLFHICLQKLCPTCYRYTEETLVDAGLVRDIGVSNFSAAKLAALMDGGADGGDGTTMVMGECRVKPSVGLYKLTSVDLA